MRSVNKEQSQKGETVNRTLKGLIAEKNITADAEYVDEHSEQYELPYGGKRTRWVRDWKVTVKYGRKRLTVDYHTGEGATDVTAYDVLYSLIMDAMGYDNARSFEDWASEYGYDTDSRKAAQVYKACERNTGKLRKFLGAEYRMWLACELD